MALKKSCGVETDRDWAVLEIEVVQKARGLGAWLRSFVIPCGPACGNGFSLPHRHSKELCRWLHSLPTGNVQGTATRAANCASLRSCVCLAKCLTGWDAPHGDRTCG